VARRDGLPNDAPSADLAGFVVVAPLAGALYLIDPTLRREYQTPSLRDARHRRARVVCRRIPHRHRTGG
jgi:hypothetical protein